jgi:hypothetical protein
LADIHPRSVQPNRQFLRNKEVAQQKQFHGISSKLDLKDTIHKGDKEFQQQRWRETALHVWTSVGSKVKHSESFIAHLMFNSCDDLFRKVFKPVEFF